MSLSQVEVAKIDEQRPLYDYDYCVLFLLCGDSALRMCWLRSLFLVSGSVL